MHATYGWNAAGRLPCFQDIHRPPSRTCTASQCLPQLIRFAQWCLLLCFVQALLTRALYANDILSQESPKEIPSRAIVGGPFPVRSLSPIQLLYYQFTPERAVTLPRGMWNIRFDLVEANILARDQNRDDSFLFDFELTRGNLALQYGL